jgi:hypothetical protein
VAQALGGGGTLAPGAWDQAGGPSPRAALVEEGRALEVVEAGHGLPARVLGVTALGATLRLELELLADGSQIQAEVPSLGGLATALPPGTIIGVRVRPGGAAAARLN